MTMQVPLLRKCPKTLSFHPKTLHHAAGINKSRSFMTLDWALQRDSLKFTLSQGLFTSNHPSYTKRTRNSLIDIWKMMCFKRRTSSQLSTTSRRRNKRNACWKHKLRMGVRYSKSLVQCSILTIPSRNCMNLSNQCYVNQGTQISFLYSYNQVRPSSKAGLPSITTSSILSTTTWSSKSPSFPFSS